MYAFSISLFTLLLVLIKFTANLFDQRNQGLITIDGLFPCICDDSWQTVEVTRTRKLSPVVLRWLIKEVSAEDAFPGLLNKWPPWICPGCLKQWMFFVPGTIDDSKDMCNRCSIGVS